MNPETSLCIRCGTERIKGKEKTIIVNLREAKLTIYVCPDKQCQKKVEAQLAAREERRLALAERRTHQTKKKKST